MNQREVRTINMMAREAIKNVEALAADYRAAHMDVSQGRIKLRSLWRSAPAMPEPGTAVSELTGIMYHLESDRNRLAEIGTECRAAIATVLRYTLHIADYGLGKDDQLVRTFARRNLTMLAEAMGELPLSFRAPEAAAAIVDFEVMLMDYSDMLAKISGLRRLLQPIKNKI